MSLKRNQSHEEIEKLLEENDINWLEIEGREHRIKNRKAVVKNLKYGDYAEILWDPVGRIITRDRIKSKATVEYKKTTLVKKIVELLNDNHKLKKKVSHLIKDADEFHAKINDLRCKVNELEKEVSDE